MRDAPSDKALMDAMRVANQYLAYGPRSASDVRSRLRKAGIPDALAQAIVERLSSSGVLNDESYAMEYVKTRVRHKRYGPQRLQAELRRHGIEDRLIQKALVQVTPEVVTRGANELAAHFWPRTQGTISVRRRKVRDYLLRRGYSPSQAMAAIRPLR